jgi:hypothetical protein
VTEAPVSRLPISTLLNWPKKAEKGEKIHSMHFLPLFFVRFSFFSAPLTKFNKVELWMRRKDPKPLGI